MCKLCSVIYKSMYQNCNTFYVFLSTMSANNVFLIVQKKTSQTANDMKSPTLQIDRIGCMFTIVLTSCFKPHFFRLSLVH